MRIADKVLYITLFCVFATGFATAQSTDTLVYRHQSVRSIGFAFPALNYSFLSPLNHSGYALSFHSTRFLEKAKSLSQFQVHSEIGLLYNDANDSYITTLAFRCGWSRHWNVTDKTYPLRLLVGASIDAGINVYLKEDNTNNPVAYFFDLSVSPSILAKYRFKSGVTGFEIGQQIDVPVGSLVSSSGYSSMLPYALTEDDANFFDAMQLVSYGSMKKCVGITTFDIIPPTEKRRKWPVMRISYIFSGMNYESNGLTVKSIDHVFLFGAIFHLFR